MIRIDEIYNHTIWPWFRDNRPGTRVFFCDPPGHTDPEHLFNVGCDSIAENDYVFMHDQEPVDLNLYQSLFKLNQKLNQQLNILCKDILKTMNNINDTSTLECINNDKILNMNDKIDNEIIIINKKYDDYKNNNNNIKSNVEDIIINIFNEKKT